MILAESEQTRIQAAEIIQSGGVIAFRTDTFYGLGVDPFNRQAISRIRALKGREEAKPILVLIADASVVDRFVVERSALFVRVCERHWPGPLTLVARARAELPSDLTAGTGTIGIRLPDDNCVRELIRVCGGALTATSANASGLAPSRTPAEVESFFPGGIDLIIDGGEVTVTEASTVLDLSGPEPQLIRAGAVTMEELQATITTPNRKLT
jgi:L-threonylcarbamoyladenylate synthase